MLKKITAVSLISVPMIAGAQDIQWLDSSYQWLKNGQLGAGSGVSYTSGNYGTDTTTSMLSVPNFIKYENGPLLLKLTIPYIEISGSGNVVGGGVGLVNNTNPNGRGKGHGNLASGGGNAAPVSGSNTASGLGDIIFSSTYTAYYNQASKFGVDITGKIKFGTADRNLGLGTGENDYGGRIDIYKTIDKFTLFGGFGYTAYGSSNFIKLSNAANGNVGTSYKFNDHNSAGISFDMREKISDNSAPLRELSGYTVHKLGKNWKLQPYVLRGFTRASPDWGGGLTISFTQ